MKKFLSIICIVFFMGLNAQNYKTHKVKAGETIESISKLYLVTPFDIYALNPDAKENLKLNTVLIIPDSKVKNEPVQEEYRELIGYRSHKVRRKETLYSLSKKYNVTESEIKKANRSLYSENLKKGDRIRIPKYRTVISKRTLDNTIKKYTVRPKEGKWRIAYKFGITVEDLEGLNPNMKEVIQPGDELNVPNIEDTEEKAIDSTYNYYEVLPKEGFYRLKIKLGLTQEQLETLNPELKEDGLKEGMVLKIPSDVDVVTNLTDIDTTSLTLGLSNFKTKKLAVMLPFQLNKIDTDSIQETKDLIKNRRLLSVVLDFHAGVLMALDSAKQLGISTNLKVLDTRYQLAETRKILEDNDFSDYDAVIGPMNVDALDRVAISLGSDRVPVIAALTKPKEVYSNVFQTIPKDELLQKSMIDFIKADSLISNIVVISDLANKPTSDMLKREFPGAKQIFSKKDKKTDKDGFFLYPTDLENVFMPGKTVVFLETDSNSFASSVISMLNGLLVDETEIVLVTLDKNNAFEGKNIDNYHLSNLKFHYPSVNKNFEEAKPNSFVNSYRNTYGVSPSKYACRGFDITIDILLRLASAEDLYKASSNAIATEYIENKFRYNKSLFGGYTNESAYIVKYEDLKIVKVN
ncbi:LysM peptidoglycan-binding domain-containing protein [Winogradskyella aurantia]|uniref:Peptidoglycan-binding protein n=1 Tax=Winogradskyella aurantia TaxID=1915063 RepID=A0A265UQP0_9FLAO|nr:LysM peptidoglycan-binding domain-containing protein [Winogradskyella aurantia]OZV67542.1 peptidoglycan-binding protein [Winogradskyella aurantia]